MVTTLQDISTHGARPQGAQYRYDQLNRIKEMQVWQDMDVLNNQWQSSSALADYRTSYRYDANGNILNLNRNGHNSVHLAMDSLSYHYISGTNRLAYVDDAVAAGNYSVDIDDQAVGNYAYDATGNLIKDVAEEIDSIVWTAYGKVLRVVRSSVSSKPDLHFAYGPDGNRLSKKAVYGNDSTVWTFYVRDAQGNTMATYKHKESSGVLHLTDHVLYGSSRLGSHERKHVELLGAGSSPITARAGIYGLERGDKRYELSNHLGNVLAVVSDRRAKASCADTLVRGYWADVMSTTDYYPFGMGMVERGGDGGYRYGFNGKEKDGEGMGGGGSTYAYGFRIYNPGLGKFLSVDPLMADYPFYTPYQFAGNKPVVAIDLDGLEEFIVIDIVNGNGEIIMTVVTHVHVSKRVEWINPETGQTERDYIQYKTVPEQTFSQNESQRVWYEPNYVPSDGTTRNLSNYQSPSPESFLLEDNYQKLDGTGTTSGADALRNKTPIEFFGSPIWKLTELRMVMAFNLPLNFDTDVWGEVTNPNEAEVWLDKLAEFMVSNPNLTVQIEGHTDNIPTSTYKGGNQELSEKRAGYVASELIERGVNRGQIVGVSGKGASEPRSSNDTEEGRAQNRRIEVDFSYSR